MKCRKVCLKKYNNLSMPDTLEKATQTHSLGYAPEETLHNMGTDPTRQETEQY